MVDWRAVAGWLLFLACAVLFLAMGVRDGDWLLIAGSALFLVGCVLFLWILRDAGR